MSTLQTNSVVAQLLCSPIDRDASQPSISFGGSAYNNSGTGIYGSYGIINAAVNGIDICNINPSGISLATDKRISLGAAIIASGDADPSVGPYGVGFAGPGSLYLRTMENSGDLFINIGTADSPTWVALL